MLRIDVKQMRTRRGAGVPGPLLGTVSIMMLAIVPSVAAQESRDPLWTHGLEGSIFATAGVGMSDINYVGTEIGGSDPGSENGKLYGIARNGVPLFESDAPMDWVSSSAAVAPDGSVYTADWSGRIYAYTQDGTLKWTYDESAGDIFLGSPAVAADGSLYLGGIDGFLYALSSGGDVHWIEVGEGSIETAPVLDADGNIYYVESTPATARLIALNPQGTERWTLDLPARDDGISTASAAPAIDFSGTLYVSYEIEFPGTDRAPEGSIIAVTKEGIDHWNFAMDTPVSHTPAVSESGMLYAVTQDGLFLALDDLGFLHWTMHVGPVYFSSPAVGHNGEIYIVAFDDEAGSGSRLLALNEEGELLWQGAIAGIVDASPVINAYGELIVGDYSGTVYAFQADGPLSPRGWAAFRRTAGNTGRQDSLVSPNPFDYYPESSEQGIGWAHTPTIGYYFRPYFPWVYSLYHGWWYSAGFGGTSMWVFDFAPELGWMWTSHSYYPLFWVPTHGAWLEYQKGTVAPRVFENLETGEFVETAG